MKNQILGYLLSIPNSNPDVLPVNKHRFYLFKDEFLRKFCSDDDGFDLQHIETICLKCKGTGIHIYESGKEGTCYDCKNGVYKSVYVVLARYHMGTRLFYKPINSSTVIPPRIVFKNGIKGHIIHVKSGEKAVLFTYLFLTFFFQHRLFWEAVGTMFGNLKRKLQWEYELFVGKIRRFCSSWRDQQDFSDNDIPF